MMKIIVALLALLASASAFAPTSQTAFVRNAALSMAKAPEMNVATVVAGAVPALLTSTAALATEGTGEWYGVDDLRLLGVLFVVHWAILGLWLQTYGDYDESQDFFGEIDYTK